ncbi:MAG: hypothetical protein ACQCN6_01505 [Candidatus Bathyarchaeia archaeon]
MPKPRKEGTPESVKLVLDGDLQRQFTAIKKRLGIRNNTDLVRNLITEKYEALKKQDKI